MRKHIEKEWGQCTRTQLANLLDAARTVVATEKEVDIVYGEDKMMDAMDRLSLIIEEIDGE